MTFLLNPFIYGGGGADYTLTADTGALALAGGTAAFKRGLRMVGAPGALVLAGGAATLTYVAGYSFTADPGALVLGGGTAALKRSLRMVAAPGALALTGGSATLTLGDANYASVVLLSQFTGTNGSTSFTDQSPAARALTAAGNSQIQSNYLELDGATDYVTAADSADWQFSGDFTLELFGLQTDNAGTLQCLASHYDAFTPQTNQRGWGLYYRGADATKVLRLDWSSAGSSSAVAVSANWTATTATDYDICVERSGTTVRLYVGGTMLASATSSLSTFNSTSPLAIGADNTRASSSSNINELDGRLKAIRITNGVARYATNGSYTVPSLPLPAF